MDNNIGSENRRLGAIFLIIGWLIILGLGAYLIHLSIFSNPEAQVNKLGSGIQLTITRGYDSHFRIDGAINGVNVTFLIDTGATSVAVPESIANEAGLKRLSEVITNTAGGTSPGYLTKIPKLKINQIELNNISAIIIPEMQGSDVLLGMNVLKKFKIEQTEDKLLLILN